MSDIATGTGAETTEAGEPKTAETTATTEASLLSAEPTPPPATEQTTTEEKATEPEVPESYEFEVPEGVTLDADAVTEFSAIAKELKLDKATAQKVADVGVRMAQRQKEAHVKAVESWTEATKADKEIGGDKLAENLAIARKAVETFGSPELKSVLDVSGLGNHPAIVKAFLKAGKAISEDGFVNGSSQGVQKDPAKIMFPSMN